jgi:hypothetical protein
MIRWGALAIGVILFFLTLYYVNFRVALGTIRNLGFALPVALLFSGVWHLVRTWAWAWCFPQPCKVPFLRLARVRLAAEAFSYLTLRGIAGEPLKVILLRDSVDAREATAAVALERLAYLVGTTIIIGIGSLVAMAALPLTPVWFRVFRAFAITAGAVTTITVLVVSGRGTYIHSMLRWMDSAMGTEWSTGRIVRLHGARGLDHPSRDRYARHPHRRARSRDVLTGRELRLRVHTGKSRRAGGIESRRSRSGRVARRWSGTRPGTTAPRSFLGRTGSRDLPARAAAGSAFGTGRHRARALRQATHTLLLPL